MTTSKSWKNMLKNNIADKIIVTGGVANLFLDIAGTDIGEINRTFIKKELGEKWENTCKDIYDMLLQYPEKIILPVDVALNVNGKRVDRVISKLENEFQIFDLGIQSILKTSLKLKMLEL